MSTVNKALATEAGQTAIKNAIDAIGASNIGNMSALTTTDKTSLVGAVNEVNAYPKNTIDLTSYLSTGLTVTEYIRLTEISKNVMLLDVGGINLQAGVQNVFADFPYTIISRLICQMSHDGSVSTSDSAMLWSNNVNIPTKVVNANCSVAGAYWGQCIFTVADH